MSMQKKISISLATLHFVSAILVAYFIAISPDGEAGMVWFIFAITDFPISMLLNPITQLLDLFTFATPIDSNGNYLPLKDINYWSATLFFVIVGTTWWYYLPKLITYIFGLLLKGHPL